MRKTLSSLSVLLAALFTPAAPTSVAQTEPMQTARVIVKYKADAVLLRKRALAVHDQHARQAEELGQRHGLALRAGAALHEQSHVVFADGMSSAQLAATLALDPDVEYAVPDKRKRLVSAPLDPLYLTVGGGGGDGPVSGQWYLRPNAGEVKSSIDAEPAWAITTGNNTVVVAVLDTGVRFDHPELKKVAQGGNVLPGYDMIADVDVANDGSGRDNDPSDPGDWVTLAESTKPGGPFNSSFCEVQDSSWHGTQTAGLIGALTDNNVGMAGVGRTVRVLPVRVLGKCGGFDSDIIAGMRWAAGLNVPGVPNNPVANRAKVINMSLGGTGVCDPLYQSAVNEIIAVGVMIVASAGNSTGRAVSSPADCTGVIAVAGLRHVGTKVGFSDLGPEISISAPGGNCVNIAANTPCLYPILTTVNSGLTAPVSNANGGSKYTDSFNASLGTSFSAPLVAGTAALLLSVKPTLTPAEVRTILRTTARAFPTTGGDNGDGSIVTSCVAPGAFDQSQCYCTTSTCGAGMLDAGAAVRLTAQGLVLPRIVVTPAAPKAGDLVTLSAATSTVPVGRTISSRQWAIANNAGVASGLTVASDGVTSTATISGGGEFTVTLTVVDSTGASATSTNYVVVPVPEPVQGSTGGSGGGALGAGWLVLLLLAVAALRVTAGRESLA